MRPSIESSSAVSLRGVAQRFGHRWAIRGVALEVPAGEVLAIVGHNGSGKSTLLRIVATALRPTRGRALVLGLDVTTAAAQLRERVALLTHDVALYGDLTAEENLRFAARMLGQRPTRAQLDGVLERVGLRAVADERARTFSSGMQRRLSIARIFLRTPDVLLLDEPFNSLDADGVALVSDLVQQTRARGATVLLVAHDLQRGSVGADRLVAMADGRFVDDAAAATTPDVSEPAPEPGEVLV
ncbi:MAG: heme ABC exporter ATP-binding protein CcmA [Gemmatimonadaceae bacterium]|nr:heme ABC exporter ATP-binding protein CcmA [Gemmatimonadaceae bacterium]